MSNISTLKELYKIHDRIGQHQKRLDELNAEMNMSREYIEGVFKRKFKVRGIHSRVEKYSIKENRITLLPIPPDSGVDRLTLTFEEFAEQVEFLDEAISH